MQIANNQIISPAEHPFTQIKHRRLARSGRPGAVVEPDTIAFSRLFDPQRTFGITAHTANHEPQVPAGRQQFALIGDAARLEPQRPPPERLIGSRDEPVRRGIDRHNSHAAGSDNPRRCPAV